jgi:hypothetical protein
VAQQLHASELLPDGPRIVFRGLDRDNTSHRYQWTENSRSILAEQIKNEIFDGATPYTTYVRGVIIDGDRGTLLTGRDDSALVTEG